MSSTTSSDGSRASSWKTPSTWTSSSSTSSSSSTAAVASPPSATSSSTEMTRRMVCGGLAGMIAKTATNPLERIKLLSQTGEHGVAASGKPVRMMGLFREIIRTEGVLGLWAGNGANLLRIFPAKAVVFSSNDFYQQGIGQLLQYYQLQPSSHLHQQPQKLPGGWSFLAGGLAGMTATLVTYPLDLARGRISGKLASASSTATANTAAAPTRRVYGGIVSTIWLTIQDEGIRGLYKGVTPTLCGAMPYEGIKFGTVGVLEALFPPPTGHDDGNNNNTTVLSPTVRKMLFGGTGGVMAGLITYPNDTIRRLLQLQGSRGTTVVYHGYVDCLYQILHGGGGIRRLYAGLGANLVRMAPNAAVQFGAYEFLKQHTQQWSFL